MVYEASYGGDDGVLLYGDFKDSLSTVYEAEILVVEGRLRSGSLMPQNLKAAATQRGEGGGAEAFVPLTRNETARIVKRHRQQSMKPLSDTRRLLASPLQRVTSAVEVAVGTAARTGGLLLKHGSSTGSMGGSMGSMKDILSFRGTKEEGHLKRSQSVEMIAIATNELPAHVSGSIEEEDDGVEGFDIFSTAPRPLGGSRGSRGSGRALQNQTF